MTAIAFTNAATSDFGITTLRIEGAFIASVGTSAKLDDIKVDLHGDLLLPGLINAHDHLQLNNLGHQAAGMPYAHVRDWIAEVGNRRTSDDTLAAKSMLDRNARLLIGGVKNLLSGVTCVAHHDPLYPFLSEPHFPVRVVQNFGWAHSLYLEDEAMVAASYRSTPHDWPWIIHAAEGLNEEAAREFDTLERLGCIASNSVLVHGIALDAPRRERLVLAGAALIWCPGSNLSLFERTAQVDELIRFGRVALGTDSRLSGTNDLLAELQLARRLSGLDAKVLERMVTRDAARLLRLNHQGRLETGALADIVVLPRGKPVSEVNRGDIRLVMIDGTPRYADAGYAKLVSPRDGWTAIRVDEMPKLLDKRIADLLLRSEARETGIEFSNFNWRAA